MGSKKEDKTKSRENTTNDKAGQERNVQKRKYWMQMYNIKVSLYAVPLKVYGYGSFHSGF